ncbi:restriction endonuclease subunit S [Bacillus cereus]|uniref:restriction endonuclease subunit S n=1 Tax=Bacillus cereus TaxID=1396 RepID=UPI0021AF9215|nr:restriction endonuclease subunit S [Bacillus cereus]MCU4791716.1 restriction endonuclease subunit S [Bacillus cereus]
MSDKITKSPQIRFAGFTDAWEQVKLKDCFIERSERSAEGELISVTINSGVVKASDLDRTDNSSSDKSNYKVVKVGDIAYNSMRMWQGASGLSPYDGILSPAYTVITPKENSNPKFFAYNFKRHEMIWTFQINSQGLTSDTWNLKFPALSSIKIAVPSYEEQTEIARFFEKLDHKLALHQRQLELLKNTKKSLLQKMFPRDGATVPEIRFAGFTDAWERRKYGEVIDLLSGQDFSPSEYNDTCNGIPYMTGASCIVGKETIVNRWTTVPRCLAEKGDVLLVCKGSGYGAIAVMAQDKAHIARQFMALKNLPNLDKVFNFYLLNSVIENIKKEARGLIAGIARDAVIKQEISIPSLAEQSQIGSLLKTLDDIIALHQRELNSFKNLKKSLLQQMFV